MDRRTFIVELLGMPLAAGGSTSLAAAKTVRLGYPTDRGAPKEFDEALRRGMRELGYVEGENLKIEYRWAAGKVEQLPHMATELVLLKVDVIVTSGVPAAKATKQATQVIPIVMATSGDAVADGLVGAVIIISDAATISHRNELGSAGLKYKLPTIFASFVR
jgi:putative ABC transport system substrate-binding protein